MNKKTTYTALFWAIAIAVLYLGAPVLIPLALAGLLATLLQNWAEWLERKGFSRMWASLTAVLSVLVLLSGFVALLALHLQELMEQSQDLKSKVQDQVNQLRMWVSETFGMSLAEQKEAVESRQADGKTGDAVMAVIGGMATVVLNTILVIVYTFLLLFYRDNIANFILRLAPTEKQERVEKIMAKSTQVSRLYLRGLFYMVACLWVMYGVGFSILGVEGALFFALLCGSLEIIPFVGNLVGNTVVVLAVLAQGGDSSMVLGVIGIYMVVQLTQTYILEPVVVGHRVSINALFTILGLIVGELIWGIAGLALAIPALGIVKIICDHVPEWKPFGELLDTKRRRPAKRR